MTIWKMDLQNDNKNKKDVVEWEKHYTHHELNLIHFILLLQKIIETP